MSFHRVSEILLEYVRDAVRNGEFTERGLARRLGISQPHAHNVLKGVRPLTPELFDTVLKSFEMDLLDLLPRGEIELHLARRAPVAAIRRQPGRAPGDQDRLKNTG